jgi:Stage II sporulation protein M
VEAVRTVIRALDRARLPIASVGLVYLASVVTGMLMVHAGSQFAISNRDRIVSGAQSSPTLTALRRGDRLEASLLDFGGNLFGALGTTVAGLGVVAPYPLVAYRGWIGGIVSIDSAHASRLADPREAVYYLSTLVLQLIPYTLAGGAGVNVGLALWRPRAYYQGEKWWIVPKETVRDVVRIYVLVVPLFLVASLWEFFMR